MPQKLTYFINLFPEHSFYEILNFCQKGSCRQEPPLSMQNSNFALRTLKCFAGYVLPLSIYSQVTSSLWKSNFCIMELQTGTPFLCRILFWHAALLHCTIVHYLAPPWPQFCLQNLSNFYMVGDDDDDGKLPPVDHDPSYRQGPW